MYMKMTKKTRQEKNKQAKENLKKEWAKFKQSIGGSDDFGRSTTNAGLSLIKGVFSIIICVIIIVAAISAMKGE